MTTQKAIKALAKIKRAFEHGEMHKLTGDEFSPIETALQPQIPEGYVLVPIEPTDVMCQMSATAYKMDCTGAFQADPREVYKAMISSAPKEGK
jgi:hypothetical protein